MSVTISGDGTITGIPLNKRIEKFTSSGTWTVPAGVTYAIAHVMGGGGGVGTAATAGDGGDSSVAFAGGTVTGPGLAKASFEAITSTSTAVAGKNNIGQSASGSGRSGTGSGAAGVGPTNTFVVAGDAVTPAASITVTVGAGGTAGTLGATGGSGYVFIEYYE